MRARLLLVVVAAIVLLAAAACGGGGGANTGATDTGAVETGAVETQTNPAGTGATAPKVQVPVPAAGDAIGPLSPAREVLLLQKALKELNFPVGKPDGQWGPKTQAAVKKFQRRHKLTADGLVGPKTAKAINKALQEQAQNP